MSVAGFEEAFSASVCIAIAENLNVPVVSLPGLATLKLFAWSDRKDDRDATDLLRVIHSYADAGNEDRLYDSSLVEEFDFDLDLAGAKLLGMDVAALCNPETLRKAFQAAVGDVLPGDAVVGALPDATANGASIVDVVFPRDRVHGDHASTYIWAHRPPFHLAHQCGSCERSGALRLRGKGSAEGDCNQSSNRHETHDILSHAIFSHIQISVLSGGVSLPQGCGDNP